MTRRDDSPRALLGDPKNCLFGVFASVTDVEELESALKDSGLADLHRYDSSAEADALDESRGETLTARIRSVVAGRSIDIEEAYAEAVRRGQTVLRLDIDDKEKLETAITLYRRYGAEEMTYFGEHSYREVT